MTVKLLGLPVTEGCGRRGCELGPAALRAAGLAAAFGKAGLAVADLGDLARGPTAPVAHPNPAVKALPEVVAWTAAITRAAYETSADALAVFLGGDHSMSGGTISGLARRALADGRPLFVLWLDAHPDVHTLETTTSGNLHGVPLAYATGRDGFAPWYPPPAAALDPRRLCMVGIRSIDAGEAAFVRESGLALHDMAAIARRGVGAPVAAFLERVAAANGRLHVSLDADVLDPELAPGVGTPEPGGLTLAEARHVMDLVRDSGLMTSLDLVELNPLLDAEGRSARVMVELAARAVGSGARGLRRSA